MSNPTAEQGVAGRRSERQKHLGRIGMLVNQPELPPLPSEEALWLLKEMWPCRYCNSRWYEKFKAKHGDMARRARGQGGYTVIELLVGITIIATALLAAGLVAVAIHFIARFW